MFQVISIVDDIYHHEGFFEDFSEAREHRDYVSEQFWNSDTDGSVFINELSLC